ncbi:hypothetical protein Q3G72_019881 [Acer saccharum]|nr:hypothetical protein Q3G72_019881 [Acer saccharum]
MRPSQSLSLHAPPSAPFSQSPSLIAIETSSTQTKIPENFFQTSSSFRSVHRLAFELEQIQNKSSDDDDKKPTENDLVALLGIDLDATRNS